MSYLCSVYEMGACEFENFCFSMEEQMTLFWWGVGTVALKQMAFEQDVYFVGYFVGLFFQSPPQQPERPWRNPETFIN